MGLMDDVKKVASLAERDRALAGMADVAWNFRAYYLAMTIAGFTDDQALALTLEYQRWVFASQAGGKA